MLLPLEIPSSVSIKKIEGERSPLQGWCSPHYGKMVPSPVIKVFGKSSLPLRLKTAFYLQDKGKRDIQEIIAEAHMIGTDKLNGEN